ncbi:50S ribosomal protein L15 [Neisseria meningitidis 98008]|nr:50S ribosomal protein L15 [Neisseria meningitidis 98008]
MPLQRRLPKRGFKSLTASANAQLRLSELESIAVNEIDILVLKQAGLIASTVSNVKVIAFGEISKAVALKGIKVTKGARAAIEAVGGKIEM